MSSGFRFARDPDPQVLAALQQVGSLGESAQSELTTMAIKFLADGDAGQLIDGVARFASEHNVDATVAKAQTQAILAVLLGAHRFALSDAQLGEDLALAGFHNNAQKARTTQWRRAQSEQLAQSHAALGQTLSVNRLLLPEWRFGLSVSSDAQRAVGGGGSSSGGAFMQLKLTLQTGDGARTQHEHLELSLPQFYEFLATLEKAKAQMDFFA
jgi:hypothetical protein